MGRDFESYLASEGEVLVGPVFVMAPTAMAAAASRSVRYALAAMVIFAAADQAIDGLIHVYCSSPISIESFRGTSASPKGLQHRVQSKGNVAGWRSKVDDEAQPVVRVYGDLMGLASWTLAAMKLSLASSPEACAWADGSP